MFQEFQVSPSHLALNFIILNITIFTTSKRLWETTSGIFLGHPPVLEDKVLQSVCLAGHDLWCWNVEVKPSLSGPQETAEVCVGTSVGTITEPDCLGPCEPGTSVTLEGIVWHETEGGELLLARAPHQLARPSSRLWHSVRGLRGLS